MPILLDFKEQHAPEKAGPCANPKCEGPSAWEHGYGLAGGGMGAYLFCPICEKVVQKNQDRDEDWT